MIVDDIRQAQLCGDRQHVLTLLHVLHHFLKSHPEAKPSSHPWSGRFWNPGGERQIYRVPDTFNWLQQPKNPIPAHITAITGTEVAGQPIDQAEVEAFVSGAPASRDSNSLGQNTLANFTK
jgi:hypothetical protein